MISNYRGRPMAVKAGRAASAFAFYVAFWILLMAGDAEAAGTSVGFYSSSCPKAEAIVQQVVMARFAKDKTVTAALLRMFFHDCFVNGCDGSILIDSTPNNQAEKEAGPNLTIRDFDLIDEAKQALEAACPGIVSCADIIAIAVRDALVLSGGPSYAVPCGRRDGLISRIADADNLPSPSFTVDQVRVLFEDKGLTLIDMVVLLGAHTVGSALCGFFSDRVFSFHGTAAPDPSMNVSLARRLANVCPNPFTSESNADPAVALDQGTPEIFDSIYFSELKRGNGILQIDQELTGDARTLPLVNQFSAHQDQFFAAFAKSILLMGNIGVKTTPAQGQIRSQCRKVNSKNAAPPPTPPKPPSPPPKLASVPSKPASPAPKPASVPSKPASPAPKPASPPPKLASVPSKPTSLGPKPASRPPPRRHHHRSDGGRTSVPSPHRRRASLAPKLISGPKSHHHARRRRGKNRRH